MIIKNLEVGARKAKKTRVCQGNLAPGIADVFFLVALASDLQGTPLEVWPRTKFITLKQFLNCVFCRSPCLGSIVSLQLHLKVTMDGV